MSNAIATATAFIADREGFRSVPYRDQAGVWTIGYGFTYMPDGSKVGPDTPSMSQQDAMERLGGMVKQVSDAVSVMVAVPLTGNQMAALTSFAFNVGTHALRTSNLLAMVNRSDFEDAAKQFGAWVYAGGKMDHGLVNRRKLEAELFMTPDDVVRSPEKTADDLNAAELNRVENT